VLAEHAEQVAGADRLRQVGVHAGLQALLAIAGHRQRREGHESDARQALRLLAPADLCGGLEAAHVGHVNVHEHQVERLALEQGQRFHAVVRNGHPVPAFLQHGHRQLLVHEVVLASSSRNELCGVATHRERDGRSWPFVLPGRECERVRGRSPGSDHLRNDLIERALRQRAS